MARRARADGGGGVNRPGPAKDLRSKRLTLTAQSARRAGTAIDGNGANDVCTQSAANRVIIIFGRLKYTPDVLQQILKYPEKRRSA
jgi:hypothetical protein